MTGRDLDPVGDAVDRLSEWVNDNRLKAEGGAVCAVVAVAWSTFPGSAWDMATANPLAFGITCTTGLLAWVVRFEIREHRLQDWLMQDGHAFRVAYDARGLSCWTWTDGQARPRRKSATETLAERRRLATVGAAINGTGDAPAQEDPQWVQ